MPSIPTSLHITQSTSLSAHLRFIPFDSTSLYFTPLHTAALHLTSLHLTINRLNWNISPESACGRTSHKGWWPLSYTLFLSLFLSLSSSSFCSRIFLHHSRTPTQTTYRSVPTPNPSPAAQIHAVCNHRSKDTPTHTWKEDQHLLLK